MASEELAFEDQRTYGRVGYTLLGGLWLSIGVMALGLILAAIEGKKGATNVLGLDRIIGKLFAGEPAAVIDLGILLLFATPVVGVLVALIEFALQRERPFVLITLVLLLVLIAGFAVALR